MVVAAGFVAVLVTDFRFVVAGFDVGGGDDDTGDVWRVAAAKPGFTVLGIPHTRASVVLTTLRSGLFGSHIIALSPGDIDLLTELAVDGYNVGEDDC